MPNYGTDLERRECVHQNFIQPLITEQDLGVLHLFVPLGKPLILLFYVLFI